jgi:undecaprenyl-diphosphatase
VLIPGCFGWHDLVAAQSADESFYLAFVVALHVATAIALLIYFRQDWARLIRGSFRTLRKRRIDDRDERMIWLLIVATIPTGITGLLLEHTLRTVFAKPLAAAIFLTANGVLLAGGELLRRRVAARQPVDANPRAVNAEPGRRLDTLEFTRGSPVHASSIASRGIRRAA